MKIRFKSKAFLLMFLLILLIQATSKASASRTTNAINLSITSIDYDFSGFFKSNHSVFNIWSNMTVENTSSENITISFGDSCLWNTEVICSFSNVNYEYSFSEGWCFFVNVNVVFPPGITEMGDLVKLQINYYNLTILPKGIYTIIIGEAQSRYYEEIGKLGKASFTVSDENEFTFTELNYSSVFLLVLFLFVPNIIYRRYKKN